MESEGYRFSQKSLTRSGKITAVVIVLSPFFVVEQALLICEWKKKLKHGNIKKEREN